MKHYITNASEITPGQMLFRDNKGPPDDDPEQYWFQFLFVIAVEKHDCVNNDEWITVSALRTRSIVDKTYDFRDRCYVRYTTWTIVK